MNRNFLSTEILTLYEIHSDNIAFIERQGLIDLPMHKLSEIYTQKNTWCYNLFNTLQRKHKCIFNFNEENKIQFFNDTFGTMFYRTYTKNKMTQFNTSIIRNSTEITIYDNNDNAIEVHNHDIGISTYYTYNKNNKLIKTTDTMGYLAYHEYDDNNNNISFDDGFAEWHRTFNNKNQCIEYSCGNSPVQYFFYDDNDNIIEIKSLKSHIIYTYDQKNNIISINKNGIIDKFNFIYYENQVLHKALHNDKLLLKIPKF